MNKTFMKAVLLTGHGGPEKLVHREDVPIPQVGPDDVFIKVGACGVNNTDIWTREGAYGDESDPDAVSGWRREAMEFPRIQGADIVGKIVETGSNVPPSRVGERVIVDPSLYTDKEGGLVEAGFMGSEHDGGFAEYAAVPATNAIAIDSPLSDAELATFPTAYVTAEHMLNRVRLKEGETILITGASGGVGTGLVQLAHLRGAQVIAIVGAGKEEKMSQLGAEVVINRHTDDIYQAVIQAIEERPIDVVADVVAGSTFPTLLKLLRKRGRYVTAGAIAGPLVQLDLRTLYLKHLELIGSTMGTHEEFADLVEYIESGKLKPLLAKTYPLAEIGQAQEAFKAKQFFGKLVIIP